MMMMNAMIAVATRMTAKIWKVFAKLKFSSRIPPKSGPTTLPRLFFEAVSFWTVKLIRQGQRKLPLVHVAHQELPII